MLKSMKGSTSMTIYLYKKTHNITGLKYLGKTTAKDPHRYKGSGIRWKPHIRKHGYDVTTEILKECETTEEVKYWGNYYSDLWDVVNDPSWANLRPEDGDGGNTFGGKKHSESSRKRISEGRKGIKFTPEHLENMSKCRIGKSWGNHTDATKEKLRLHKHTEEFKKQLSEDRKGPKNPNFGKPLTDATKEKIRNKLKDKPMAEETKEKLRIANTGRKRSEETVEKIKAARAKQVISEETKAKMKASQLKRWEAIKNLKGKD
jgi:hypothetical protein